VLHAKVQISALEKPKQARATEWRNYELTLESKIFEINGEIRRFEKGIKNLVEMIMAEKAEEIKINVSGTCFP
jgi:hypothetical protein